MTTSDTGLDVPLLPTRDEAYYAEFGRRSVRREQQRNDAETVSRFAQASAEDPAVAAEAIDVGGKLGMPPEVARLSLDVARQLLRERDTRHLELARRNPYYAATIASRPAAAAVLAEDTDGLLEAQSLWDEIRYGFDRGDTLAQMGLLGANAIAGGVPIETAKREYAEMRDRTAMRVRSGFMAGSAELVGQQLRAVPAIAGAALAGSAFGPAGTIGAATGAVWAQSAMVEAGSAFLGMLDEGADVDSARIAAIGVGLVNATLETAGAAVVSAPFRKLAARAAARELPAALTAATAGPALGKFLSTYTKGLGAEIGTETLQEITQMLGEAVVRPEGAPAPAWGEVFGRLAEIAGKTAQGMALLGLPGPTLELAAAKGRIAASKQHQSFLERAAQTGDKSKVLGRSADIYEEHIAATAKGTAAENVHVDAAELDAVLKQTGVSRDEFAKLLPETAAKLAEAAANGADLVIPIGTYQARVAATPLGQALKPHVRLSADSFSAAELASDQHKRFVDKLTADSKAAMEASEQFAIEAKEVEEAIYEQTVAAGRPAGEARQAAILHRNVIAALAARAGKTPKQLTPVTVQAGTAVPAVPAAAGTVQQLSIESPEFKAWFGDSQAVEHIPESGFSSHTAQFRPRVFYHGTRDTFTQFETARPTWNRDIWGEPQATQRHALFFAADPSAAATYAARGGEGPLDAPPGAQVMPVYLQARNPLDFTDQLDDDLLDALEREGFYRRALLQGDWGLFDGAQGARFVAALQRLGFDSAVLNEPHHATGADTETWVVFSPTQVKSVNNRGTFDPNDPNVLRSPANEPRRSEPTGDRSRRAARGAAAPLEGAPVVAGATGPDPRLVAVAEAYAQSAGIPLRRQAEFVTVDPERAARIAAAYDAMPHAPQDPEVKAAYADLIRQTLAQYRALEAAGYRFFLFDEATDPYEGNPWNAMRDLRAHQSMGVFTTESGFGSGASELDTSNNPLLADTGIQWPFGSLDGPPRRVLANDLFRAVHDAFGHGLEGAGFRARGEENAWQAHARLFTGPALAALTSETRGQNSWLNFGPHGEKNQTAKVEDTVFADQKTGLMPSWTWTEGRAGDMVAGDGGALEQLGGNDLRDGARADGGGEPPAYGVPQQGSTSVIGVHFSRERRASLDSNFYGTGLKGAEARRVAGDPILSKRIHFYVDTGGGIAAEPGTGEVRHEVRLDNVYDVSADPLGLVAAWRDGPRSLDPNALEEAIVAAGFDGVFVSRAQRLPNGEIQGVVAILGPKHTSVPVAAARETAAVRAGPESAPRGTFDPKRLLVSLTKGSADPSTIFHELGHYYIDTLARLASEAGAASELVADMQVLLDWFGVKDLQTWNVMSLAQQAPHLEAFTYNWEAWLHTGKAPTLELQGVFSRVAAWFRKVYRSIRDELSALYRQEFGRELPGLTPEVRGVFERMVASEDAINRTAGARGLFAIHGGLQGEMAQEQWDAYKALVLGQNAAAIDELTRQGLKDMRWLSGARSRLLKEAQDAESTGRARVRAEVEAQLRETPTYRVLDFLAAGTLKDDAGNDQRPRIQLGDMESFEARWPDGKQKLRGLAGKDGNIGPDTLAEMYGFDTGVEMLDAIIAAPPLDVAVEQTTDARMMAEHAELIDPDKRSLAIEAALHNEVRERVLAAEIKALEKTTKPDRLVIAAAKEVAQRLLAREKVGLVDPVRFAEAEARAGKRLQAALKDADLPAAIFYARQQLVQNQLVKLSVEALREIAAAKELSAKLRATDKQLAKTRNVYYVQAARAILSGIGLFGGQKLPLEHLQQLREYNQPLFDAISPVIDAAIGDTTLRQYDSVKDGLTVQQLRDVLQTVEGLWKLSRDDKVLQLENEAVELDAAIADLSAPLLAMPAMGSSGKRDSERTARDTIADTVNAVKGATRRVEFWAEAMDGGGGKVGPFTRFVWRPVRSALDRYRKQRNDVVRRYTKLVDALKLRGSAWERIPAPELGTTFTSKAELLGAMLHTGNLSNLQKLLRGYRWGDFKTDGSLDTSRWDAFVTRMIRTKVLTKNDFDFLQATWDLAEELKPDLQRAHFKVFGFHFKEVEAKGFQNEFGSYRGGYVPAAADKSASVQARLQDQMAALEGDFRQTVPSTPSGFTKERVEAAARPLALDIRRMVGHFDQVVRFVHVQPAIRNALKILRDQEFSDLLTSRDKTAVEKMLLPWLGRAARQTTQQAGLSPAIDKFWTAVRQRTGLALMAGNLSNAMQQTAGLVLAATKVHPRYLWTTLRTLLSDRRRAMVDSIVQASPFMSNRLGSQMSELSQELHELTETPNKFRKVQAWGQRHGYFLQVKLQNALDVVVWQGAYDQAMATSTVASSADAHTEAVARADAAVRTTQQSLAPEDLAAYETGTPFVKLFTHMSGYFNLLLNGNVTQVGSILREAGWTGAPGKLTTAVLLGFLLPTVLADAIAQTMSGRWDDEDDDGYSDDVAAWFFGSIGRGSAALLPGGTNLMVPFNALNEKPYDDRVLTAPVTSALEAVLVGVPRSVARAARGEGVSERGIKDWLTLASLASRLPLTALTRPVAYVNTVQGYVSGDR